MEYSPILKYEEKATSQQWLNLPLGIKYKKHRYHVPNYGLGSGRVRLCRNYDENYSLSLKEDSSNPAIVINCSHAGYIMFHRFSSVDRGRLFIAPADKKILKIENKKNQT
jgi:hypothetical protein